MKNGLAIVVTPGGYWALTQVGWLRRVEGDEWELVGARTLRRTGESTPLARLAAKGPGNTIALQDAAEIPEPIHRLTIRRLCPCIEGPWLKHCPKPKGWVDSNDERPFHEALR